MTTTVDISRLLQNVSKEKQNKHWMKRTILYQPFEFDQILLPDNANCLAIKTFLRMCNIKHDIHYKVNAEEMSPTGKVPLVKFGNELVTDLRSVVQFLANKNISLTRELDPIQKVNMDAYMSLINLTLQNAEEYFVWFIDENRIISKDRYSSKHPWPLNFIKAKQKYYTVRKILSVSRWSDKTIEEVINEVNLCFKSIAANISSNKHFFGDVPTQLDALLFGHVFTILTTTLPNNRLAEIVLSYPILCDYCRFIEDTYYNTKG